MSWTVRSTPPFIEDRTCTASLPERRKTPSHRSWTVYVSSSLTPTMLEPAPMPARSDGTTLWVCVLGNLSSRVSANSIFSVLAGGSRQCALCAASTSPDSASATIQERAVTSCGGTGTPPARSTCVPGCPRRLPPTVDMLAGGVAVGLVEGVGAARAAGAVRERDSSVAEVTSEHRLAVFRGAGTVGNVPVTGREVPPPAPPRTRSRTACGDTERMKLSRPVSWFLLAFGVWSWIIWVTFVKNLVKDSSGLAFDDGHPTAYFWVHLTLAVVSFVLGTVIGGIGLRGLRALRRTS